MSDPGKGKRLRRWGWLVVRVVVSAAFLLWVFTTLPVEDSYRVELEAEPGASQVIKLSEVKALDRSGDRVVIAFHDGRPPSSHRPEHVLLRPGLKSMIRQSRGTVLSLAAACLIVPIVLMALRWWVLLRAEEMKWKFFYVLRLVYTALFFKNFLPGSLGFDASRLALGTMGESRKGAVAMTVIWDRALGLSALVVLGTAFSIPMVSHLGDSRIAYVMCALTVGVIVLWGVLLNGRLWRWLGQRVFKKYGSTPSNERAVAHRVRNGAMTIGGSLSFLIHGCSCMAVFLLAIALRIDGLTIWHCFVFVPIITLLVALPVSIGGWGVQEWAYAQMLSSFSGVDEGQAIVLSLAHKLLLVILSLPGAVVFAFHRRK